MIVCHADVFGDLRPILFAFLLQHVEVIVALVFKSGRVLVESDGAKSGSHALHVRESHERLRLTQKKFDDRTLAPC